MRIKVILQGSLGYRYSQWYRGGVTYESLNEAIGKFEIRIHEELKSFKDDPRADCMMCYIWPSADLAEHERKREIRLIKRDRVLEGSGCIDLEFLEQLSVRESAERLIQFGMSLLTDALAHYNFDDELTSFIRTYSTAKSAEEVRR